MHCKQYFNDEAHCYHVEQLISFSKKDYKIRNIDANPKVGNEVMLASNDDKYQPVFSNDAKEFRKMFGDVAFLRTWDPDTSKREQLYYLDESYAKANAYKVVRIKDKNKEGKHLFNVQCVYFTVNSQWDIYEGDNYNDKSKRIMTIKSNVKENKRALTVCGGPDDGAVLALIWTDIMQATENFRCKIAPNCDHSLIMAILVAARMSEIN